MEPKLPKTQVAIGWVGYLTRCSRAPVMAARGVTGVGFLQRGRWPLEQALSNCRQEYPAPQAEKKACPFPDLFRSPPLNLRPGLLA